MDKTFGGAESPLRENPVYRKHMETYIFLDQRVAELNERRGYLPYDEMVELEKLKKLKLAERDSMERIENGTKGND